MSHLIPTTVVGSYPQPNWLIDREQLGQRLPPRVPAPELWRVGDELLAEAQDDATVLAIRDMELAGVDTVTDGEVRRESYSNRFATSLEGVDVATPGTAIDRSGQPNPVPRVAGPIARRGPVHVADLTFLRAHATARVAATVPGPFTMSQQAQDDHYGDGRALALAYAAAVNEELLDLQAAGADAIQLDEPYLQPRAQQAEQYALEVIERALSGVTVPTALHTCFGYAQVIHDKPEAYPFLAPLNECAADMLVLEAAQPRLDLSRLEDVADKQIALGVLDLGDLRVETPEEVAERLRRALAHIDPERLVAAPDCGMKYLPRQAARGKLQSLVTGAAIVRSEL